jgi:S-DNA-T family DNA segregation ATPase FtsK/SpoIIIE
MPKKKGKPPVPEKNKLRNEILGVVTIALSILIGISIYVGPSGWLGAIAAKIILGTFGLGAYTFPFVIFLIGCAAILNPSRLKLGLRFISGCLIIYNLLLLYHIKYACPYRTYTFMDRLSHAYNFGINKKGGGIISELLCIPSLYIFGKVGAYVVFCCTLIILAILCTQISLADMAAKIKSDIQQLREHHREKTLKNKKTEKNNMVSKQLAIKDTPGIEGEKKQSIFENNINAMDKKIKILDFMRSEPLDADAPLIEASAVSSRTEEGNQELKKKGQDGIKQVKEKSQASCSKASNGEGDTGDIKDEIHKSEEDRPKVQYVFPSLNLLAENKNKGSSQDTKSLVGNARIIEETLESFGVDATVVQVSRGPAVTRYELHPSAGVKISRIVNLADDIALNLAASSVRIEAPIPGKAAVGIEVPNKEVVAVTLREVLESQEFQEYKSKVAFALGKDIGGKCMVADIAKMPHLLIAGATGSGKSVCINTLITSIIYKAAPEEVKLLMIDPKVVELSVYNGIPHLMIPVVTDPKKASSALYWAVNEMTQRYKTFADNNVRNIESYNKLVEGTNPQQKMSQIIIIIDELADLMMAAPNEVEDSICRLAQMARAAGMHLVIATQRPSVDVITGVIKANIPSRISFAVSSQIDSRTILDAAGAEKLLGKGDMLFLPIGENKPVRIQGAFISEKEVEAVVSFLKQSTTADYNNEALEEIESKNTEEGSPGDADELLPEAIKICVDFGQASASMLQRRLRVGFNRAARLIEQMEERGIVGPQDGSRPRQVLMSKEEYENEFSD